MGVVMMLFYEPSILLFDMRANIFSLLIWVSNHKRQLQMGLLLPTHHFPCLIASVVA